jgi:hypothetical protein
MDDFIHGCHKEREQSDLKQINNMNHGELFFLSLSSSWAIMKPLAHANNQGKVSKQVESTKTN